MKPILYFERFRNIFRDNKRIIILLAVATLVLFTAFRVDAHIQEKQELQNQIETRETELQALSEELQELESEVVDKETSLEEKAQERAEMKREIEKLRKELQAKKERESRVALAPVVQASPVGDCEQYRPLLEQYSDWDVDTMLHAMRLESGCNPNAVGDDYPINGLHAPSCGLLQIRTLVNRPPCEELKDPAINIAWAYGIWQRQSYSAWTTLH